MGKNNTISEQRQAAIDLYKTLLRWKTNFGVKTIKASQHDEFNLSEFPSFSVTGSIKGMKEQYYGKSALLVKCGQYIYNVTNAPEIYFNDGI